MGPFDWIHHLQDKITYSSLAKALLIFFHKHLGKNLEHYPDAKTNCMFKLPYN